MIQVRPSRERGQTQLGWLDSQHSFSFDRYYDPRYLGFRALRVINEDWIKPGAGFGTHSHRDMEILTYVLEGALEHRDSLGTGSVIRPGEVQRMTAGTGISHSEHNPSLVEPTHLLQIWIVPAHRGLEPGYEQRPFEIKQDPDHWRLIAVGDGREGALTIHQDADVFAAVLTAGSTLSYRLEPDRHAWAQIARGEVHLNDVRLGAGDGAAISGEEQINLSAVHPSELLLFDLP
jgi:hypothetical protein